MTPYSRTACIAYGLVILFVLLNPVTGQGFALDISSCPYDARRYLRGKIKRAARISQNSGTVLNFPGRTEDYTGIAKSLMDPLRHILGGVTAETAVIVLRRVFTDIWLDRRVGIANYYDYLGNFDSRTIAAVDMQGNLVIVQAIPSMQRLPFVTLTSLKLVYCNGNLQVRYVSCTLFVST